MVQPTVKLLMLWLVMGPPALCKAGVLVACCDTESQSVVIADVPPPSPCCGGCEKPQNTQQSEPESLPRECGSCAGVCGTLMKPTDESSAVSVASLFISTVDEITRLSLWRTEMESTAHLTGLPVHAYPPSDLPLLI